MFSLLVVLSAILGKSLKILTVAVWGEIYVWFFVRRSLRASLWCFRQCWEWGSRWGRLPNVWIRLNVVAYTVRDIGRLIVIIHFLLKILTINIKISQNTITNHLRSYIFGIAYSRRTLYKKSNILTYILCNLQSSIPKTNNYCKVEVCKVWQIRSVTFGDLPLMNR